MCRAARVRTHWSEPEDDGGRERDGREADGWAAVVASGDAAPIRQTAEHDLDAAARPVAALVVSDRLIARSAARDAGLDALGFQGVPEPIGVITTVAKQPCAFGRSSSKAAAPVYSLTCPAVMKKLNGRPSASLTACSLVFMPPFVWPIRRPRSPF